MIAAILIVIAALVAMLVVLVVGILRQITGRRCSACTRPLHDEERDLCSRCFFDAVSAAREET